MTSTPRPDRLPAAPPVAADVSRGPGSVGGPVDPVEAQLAEVAWLCDDRDRTMGRIARLLVALQASGELAERLGG